MKTATDSNADDGDPDKDDKIVPANGKPVQSGFPSADLVRANGEKAGYPPEAVNLLTWLISYARNKQIKSYGELAKLLGLNVSTVSRLLSGTYGAEIGGLVSRIDNFRKVHTERSKVGEIPFIQTRLATEIWQLCDFTRISKTIAFLNGRNQEGKTTNLREYQRRNNHGKTHYVRIPVGGSCGKFVEQLCEACGISKSTNSGPLLDRLHKYLRSDQLLIIDELHQLFIHGIKLKTIETIRELHDLTGVGIVGCGTDVIEDELNNPKWKGFVGQLVNRSTIRKSLPSEPYDEDVLAFCETFGFGIPSEGTREHRLVFAIARSNGIGKLCKILEMAQRLATNAGQPYTWAAFLTTYDFVQQSEKGKGGK